VEAEIKSLLEQKGRLETLEKFIEIVKSIITTYPSSNHRDTAKNCLNTIKVIINNIVKNPNEEKFRKMKKANPNFNEKVGKLAQGINCLTLLGFKEEGEQIVLANVDTELLNRSISILEEEVKSL